MCLGVRHCLRVRLVDLYVQNFGRYDTKGIIYIICYILLWPFQHLRWLWDFWDTCNQGQREVVMWFTYTRI